MKIKKGTYEETSIHEFYSDLEAFKKAFLEKAKDVEYCDKEIMLKEEAEKLMKTVFDDLSRTTKETSKNDIKIL